MDEMDWMDETFRFGCPSGPSGPWILRSDPRRHGVSRRGSLRTGWVVSALGADSIKAFGEAPILFKRLALCLNLAIEQSAGDSNKHQSGVSGEFGVARAFWRNGLDGRSIPLRLSISSISSILSMLLPDPLRYGVSRGTAPGHQCRPARVIFAPGRKMAVAEKILVVEPEFFKAGTCDLSQLDFHLFRGGADRTSFGDILNAAACSLHHLVVSAAPAVDVTITEPCGDIVTELGNLEALQLPVPAVFWNEGVISHASHTTLARDVKGEFHSETAFETLTTPPPSGKLIFLQSTPGRPICPWVLVGHRPDCLGDRALG